MADGKDFWTSLGVGGYSALNSAGLGLPDFLLKTLAGSKGYKNWKDTQAKYKEADLAGNVAGTVGSMFIPGGMILKGAGGVAKALGAGKVASGLAKAGNIASGASKVAGGAIKQGLAKGALQAAEQAIPKMAVQGLATGDWGQSLSDATGNIATGGVVGGVFGKGSQLVGKALGKGDNLAEYGLKEAKEGLAKSTLAGTGLNTRGLRKAADAMGLKSPSSKVNSGGDYVDYLADELVKRGVHGKRGFETLVGENKKAWDKITSSFNDKVKGTEWNKKLVSMLDNDNELLQDVIEQGDDAALKAFDEFRNTVGTESNINSIRKILGNAVRNNLTSMNPQDKVKARVAMAMKSKVDDFVADMSGEDVTEAKKLHKLVQPFVQTESRDIFELPRIAGGSPTMEKMKLYNALGKGGGFTAAGGLSAAQDISQGEDVDFGRLALASAGGMVAPKAIAALGNKAINTIGRQGYKLLSGKGGEALAEMAGKIPNAIDNLNAVSPALRIKQSLQPELFDDIEQPAIQSTQPAKEAPVVEEQEPNETFANSVVNKLQADYDRMGLADQGIDFNEFVEVVRQKTNNFDPRKSAKVLYAGDEKAQAKYVSDLDKAEKINELDLQLAKAQGFNVLGFNTGIGKAKGADKAKGDLEGVFFSILSDNGQKSISRDTKDMVREQINDILGLGEPPEVQKELLLSLLNDQYGVNIGELRDRGLV